MLLLLYLTINTYISNLLSSLQLLLCAAVTLSADLTTHTAKKCRCPGPGNLHKLWVKPLSWHSTLLNMAGRDTNLYWAFCPIHMTLIDNFFMSL